MEQRRNERAGETGVLRENPPTSGIVRHDSNITHIRKRPSHELNPVLRNFGGLAAEANQCARLPSLREVVVLVACRRGVSESSNSRRTRSNSRRRGEFSCIGFFRLAAEVAEDGTEQTMTRALVIAGLLCGMVAALPLHQVSEDDGDIDLVGSSLSEVRVAPPEGFVDQQWAETGDHRREHADKDEVGYLRTKDTGGDHGYQAFDSFHKKGGDRYGFETHSAFGKVVDAQGGGGHKDDKGGKGEGSEHHDEYQDGNDTASTIRPPTATMATTRTSPLDHEVTSVGSRLAQYFRLTPQTITLPSSSPIRRRVDSYPIKWGRGGLAVRILASYLGKPGLISAGLVPDLRKWKSNESGEIAPQWQIWEQVGHTGLPTSHARNSRLDFSPSPPTPPRVQYGVAPECKGGGNPEIREKTRRPAASSGTISANEDPGAAPTRIEPSSRWWEASSLTTTIYENALLTTTRGIFPLELIWAPEGRTEALQCSSDRMQRRQKREIIEKTRSTPATRTLKSRTKRRNILEIELQQGFRRYGNNDEWDIHKVGVGEIERDAAARLATTDGEEYVRVLHTDTVTDGVEIIERDAAARLATTDGEEYVRVLHTDTVTDGVEIISRSDITCSASTFPQETDWKLQERKIKGEGVGEGGMCQHDLVSNQEWGCGDVVVRTGFDSQRGRSWTLACRTMPLVSGFSGRSPFTPTLAFRRCSIFTSLHPHRLSKPRC
ncbi:hypothetical protein PR048_032073 [Dryococelus australis]|uniref:Uncharacterized protein n=1 Tax=Dryococelus australis TaxID=614101 RepID=A0ABQ9G172_9NEOP|nr:hypothetical protein PR048_032073 [Dryococelus australis]